MQSPVHSTSHAIFISIDLSSFVKELPAQGFVVMFVSSPISACEKFLTVMWFF